MTESTDLLRRAAEHIRTNVARLPEPWSTHPWRAVYTDTESRDGMAACREQHAEPFVAHDCCWSSEPAGHESVAALAVLMHPPVALALADLLDRCADRLDSGGLPVARAILREDDNKSPRPRVWAMPEIPEDEETTR